MPDLVSDCSNFCTLILLLFATATMISTRVATIKHPSIKATTTPMIRAMGRGVLVESLGDIKVGVCCGCPTVTGKVDKRREWVGFRRSSVEVEKFDERREWVGLRGCSVEIEKVDERREWVGLKGGSVEIEKVDERREWVGLRGSSIEVEKVDERREWVGYRGSSVEVEIEILCRQE